MEHISGASSMHCKKNCKTYKLVYDEIYVLNSPLEETCM